MAENPVRLFVPDHPEAARNLLGRLREEEMRIIEAITSGYIDSLSDYREKIGYIKALRFAMNQCEDIERDL